MIEQLLEIYEAPTLIVAGAIAIGLVFGVAAEVSRYCTRSAVMEWTGDGSGQGAGAGDARRPSPTTMVLLAMLTALAGTQALAWSGVLDLSQTIYWSAPLRPLALTAGGLLFGAGMVLARGCVSRLLVLAASGNGRALVTLLVTGLTAYATMRGLLYAPRSVLEGLHAVPAGASTLTDPGSAKLLAPAVGIALIGLLALHVRRAGLGAGAIAAGLVIGLLATFGWAWTALVAADAFDPVPVTSLSFVAPVAETVQYAMVATGDTVRWGTALVIGTVGGAFLSAILSGRFRAQGFTDDTPLWRYATGGVLMGFGGVVALGCTVGQGLAGVSTAAPGSVLAIAAILTGAAATLSLTGTRRASGAAATGLPIAAR